MRTRETPAMTLSSLTLLAAAIIGLTLSIRTVTTQGADPRLAEELKCLDKNPADQCSMVVTFKSPVNTVTCDQLVPENQGTALEYAPTVQAPDMTTPITEGLLVMFDPDAHVNANPKDGFIHWIAKVLVAGNGVLQVNSTIINYYGPAPPRGNAPHRYQLFLFISSLDSKITVGTSRVFELCRFLEDNYLGQPVAAIQFRFARA